MTTEAPKLKMTDFVRLWWNNYESDMELAEWLDDLWSAGATDIEVKGDDVLATVSVERAINDLGYSLSELSEQYEAEV